MQNKNLLIIIILPFFLFVSCDKKEIFSPNKYIETESYQSGASSLEVEKRFVYSEKEQLISLWLRDGNTTLTFEYNKDKTIKKITSSENDEATYAILFYENKLITQIQYYEGNQLAMESIFSRKEKKNTINKIENYVYVDFSFPKKKNILADLLFTEMKNVPKTAHKNHKSGEKSLFYVLDITYENDNIFRVRLSYFDNDKAIVYSVSTYTYDDMKNPYYGLPYAIFELTGYSKNNVKYVTTSLENDKYKTMFTIDNNYSYEKKYPVYKSVTESENYIIGYDTSNKPIFTTISQYSAYYYTYR